MPSQGLCLKVPVIYIEYYKCCHFKHNQVMRLFPNIVKLQYLVKIKKYNYLNYSSLKMSRNALLLLANGAEEMEVVVTADVLRRAGIEVTIAGISGPEPVKCSRDVVIVPDKSLSEAKGDFDVVVLPGGLGGSNALAQSEEVGNILKAQQTSNKLIAAICAAPIALKSHGIGLQKQITSHPSKAQELKDSYKYSEERVVVDGQLITSRGPGTAFEFALAIVENLIGIDKVNEISPPMILK